MLFWGMSLPCTHRNGRGRHPKEPAPRHYRIAETRHAFAYFFLRAAYFGSISFHTA